MSIKPAYLLKRHAKLIFWMFTELQRLKRTKAQSVFCVSASQHCNKPKAYLGANATRR